MKNKYVFVVVMLCVILVAGMGFTNLYVNYSEGDTSKEALTVVTSFYPMYVAAMNVVGDAPGVKLQNLSEPQTGCLHDFQLTPEDMKLLSTADVFIINGGGIEAFMEDVAKAYPNLTIVSTCEYLELLSDGDETNAHAWMSVGMYREMVQTIAMGLAEADPDNRALYEENAEIYDSKLMRLEERQQTVAEAAEGTDVILFHEAYDYVADDYGMQVSCVMDLDEERQVSAGEVSEVLRAINEDGASLILAEELYGKSMAETVQKEADVSVIYLDPLNRGDYEADSYLLGMEHNIELLEAYFVK
ncbi:MAG: metal ABC transporter substrate-binding protein [Lachnospiraceae bacterium]|nr:metal ABC transporter substrate-binding protein [Lachnospiraceae bacterium]MDY5520368.1 metal ABC transporter substrate-binding protein [Agathobacter sp.]